MASSEVGGLLAARTAGATGPVMLHALVPTLVAALASPTFAPLEVADFDVTKSAETTSLTAFDDEGEILAEVVVWTDDGQPRVDAVWPDGLYVSLVGEGGAESEDLEQAVERLVALETALAELTEDESLKCLGAIIVMVGGCSSNPLACAGGAFGVHWLCVKAAEGSENDDEGESGDEEAGS